MAAGEGPASNPTSAEVCGWRNARTGDECAQSGPHFCVPRADHVCGFFEELLVHTKGTYARRRFALRDWQREILRPVFGEVVWSDEHSCYVRRYRIAYIEMARKNGKALDVATPVLTADGWRKMGDLRAGDQVHAPDGSLTDIVAVSPVWDGTDCYRVRFADGAELVASAEHLWAVNVRGGHGVRRREVSTQELAMTLTYGARGDRRYTVDVPDALDRPPVALALDPYLLGVWLGDGSTGAAVVTSADPEIFDAFGRAGYPFGKYCAQRGKARAQSFLGLLPTLRELCLVGDKHVPDPYMTASREQRLALLRGLMDTDGSVIIGPNTPRVEFCNTNRRLADAVLQLARSLGWKATLKESRATLYGKDCGPRYRVCWTAYRDRSPFALARKTGLLARAPARPTRSRTNAIASVERVPTVDTVCIQVAHPSGTFLAGESLTPTHNSQLLAGIVLYLLFADGEYSAEIFGVAKDRRQATLIFDVAAQMVLMSPVLSREAKILHSTKRIVRRSTNSVYQVIASDGASALGSNPSGVAADEILAWPKPDIWDALRSGMGSMDRKQPLMVAATTAPGDDETFGAALHREMQRVADDPARNPHTFAWIRNLPLDADIWDERNWHIPNPALGDFLSLAEMRKLALEAANDPARELAFRRFQLNQLIGSSIQWMPMHLWDHDDNVGTVFQGPADTLDAFAGRECWFGLDLSGSQDLTAMCYVFPAQDACDVVWRFWAPAAAIRRLDKETSGAFTRWAHEGWLTVCEGDVIDYRRVYTDIETDAARFYILGGDADKFGAFAVIQELEARGLSNIDAYNNDFTHMSNGMHRLFDMVTEHKFRHHGNPLARYCFDNCEAKIGLTDPDQIKPDKKDRNLTSRKIDGVPAAIMAVNAWSTRGSDVYSVYNSEDLLIL